jgi:hypothetical protein
MFYYKSPSGIIDENITLLALCIGAVGAKVTNRLIIAHMSRSELQFWDWIYVSPLMLILNQYYDFHFNEHRVLLLSTSYAYVSLIIFCVVVCKQFCDYLNLSCFTITTTGKKPAQDGAVPNGPAKDSISRVSSETNKKR